MIRKFCDEDNTFIFIESEEKLIMWLNGKCEYTFLNIENTPLSLEDSYHISGLDIWYPIKNII